MNKDKPTVRTFDESTLTPHLPDTTGVPVSNRLRRLPKAAQDAFRVVDICINTD